MAWVSRLERTGASMPDCWKRSCLACASQASSFAQQLSSLRAERWTSCIQSHAAPAPHWPEDAAQRPQDGDVWAGVLGRKPPWKARDSCRAGKAGRGQGTQCPWGGSSITQAALSPVPAGVPCHQAVPKDSDTPAVRLLPRDRPHLWAPACPQGSEGTPVCGVPQDLLLPGPPSTALLCELCPLLGLEGAQASRLL